MLRLYKVPSSTATHWSPARVPANVRTTTPASGSARTPVAPASPADAPAPSLLQNAAAGRSEPADANLRRAPVFATAILLPPIVHLTGSAAIAPVRADYGCPSCRVSAGSLAQERARPRIKVRAAALL